MRRVFLVALLCVPIAIGGAAPARAAIETAPPPVVPEFETPAPTPATPAPTVPAELVDAAGGLAALGLIFLVSGIALAALFILSLIRLFTKAGEPGWAAIVPIYNSIVLLRISGKPWWWIFILWLIVPAVIAQIDLAHNFGKSTGFGIGLIFLPFIFFPVLAFGAAQYLPRASVVPET